MGLDVRVVCFVVVAGLGGLEQNQNKQNSLTHPNPPQLQNKKHYASSSPMD